MEANQAGIDETILPNQNGHVAEGRAANIFVVRDTQLFTPYLVNGALQGITRSAVVELAARGKNTGNSLCADTV